MMIKMYFKAENAGYKTFYGCHTYVDGKLVDKLCGSMPETELDTLNNATKNALVKHQARFKNDTVVTFKYADLTTTKQMTKLLREDKFYKLYNKDAILLTSPAVFSSDEKAMNCLTADLSRYKASWYYYHRKNKSR